MEKKGNVICTKDCTQTYLFGPRKNDYFYFVWGNYLNYNFVRVDTQNGTFAQLASFIFSNFITESGFMGAIA